MIATGHCLLYDCCKFSDHLRNKEDGVRPTPPGQPGAKIPGAIYIPYNEILKAALKILPKEKKVILVCVTGQTQNLPMLVLRSLGYQSYTMSFGHTGGSRGTWVRT